MGNMGGKPNNRGATVFKCVRITRIIATALVVFIYSNRIIYQTGLKVGVLLGIIAIYFSLYYLIAAFRELGHMLIQWIAGYRFVYCQILSLVLMNKNGKLCLKKSTNILRDCASGMAPPDLVDGKFPYVPVLLGGVFTSFVMLVAFIILLLLAGGSSIGAVIAWLGIITNLETVILNGIPYQLATAGNLAACAIELKKDGTKMPEYWVLLKHSEWLADERPLTGFPEEWRDILRTSNFMRSACDAVISIVEIAEHMKDYRYKETVDLINAVLYRNKGISEFIRASLTYNLIYCELMTGNRRERIATLRHPSLLWLIQKVKKEPFVLRTEYAYTLLHENDLVKAEEHKRTFEKVAKHYPCESVIEQERIFMEEAYKKWSKIIRGVR